MNINRSAASLIPIVILLTLQFSTAFYATSVSRKIHYSFKNDNLQNWKELRLYYIGDEKFCYINDNGDPVVLNSSKTNDEIDDDNEIIIIETPSSVSSSAPPLSKNFVSTIVKSIEKEKIENFAEKKIKPKALKEKSIYSCRRELWAMCRPSNFGGVLIFHILGTFLGLRANNNFLAGAAAAPAMEKPIALLVQTLVKPSMMTVLSSIMLISSTSMMVNDYYDSRRVTTSASSNLSDPIVSGEVPLVVVKRCLSYLYATLLVSLAFVPGIPARLAVVTGSLLTFWYTQHLKPITWLKNVVCAGIIALSPFTSYTAAAMMSSSSSGLFMNVLQDTKLWALTGSLFCGFIARELLMDMRDTNDDFLHNVLTVPVKHGRRFASRTALVLSLISTSLAALAGGTTGWSKLLALAGGGLQTMRIAQMIFLTPLGCENDTLLKNIIEEGKVAILLLFASFL
mmetsp:Transcript_39989/g.45502  ORF Transcript_39989/g.45502 Transcript_39989/m.45502 type:complete len:455 (+) Transcript_39989:214-1578(+)